MKGERHGPVRQCRTEQSQHEDSQGRIAARLIFELAREVGPKERRDCHRSA